MDKCGAWAKNAGKKVEEGENKNRWQGAQEQ